MRVLYASLIFISMDVYRTKSAGAGCRYSIYHIKTTQIGSNPKIVKLKKIYFISTGIFIIQ